MSHAFRFVLLSIAGCGEDEEALVGSGAYVLEDVRSSDTGEIPELALEVDREQGTASFRLPDGSTLDTTATAREDRVQGCPTNVSVTLLEVLDLGDVELVAGEWVVAHPLIVAECSDGGVGVGADADLDDGGGGACSAFEGLCLEFAPQ